jgi:two-component system chemotaxis response regulator CheY
MKRVLIVDDSAMARIIIRRCLEIAGGRDWEFVEAGDGEAALTILREGRVDMLVTDLNMPTLDGAALLRRVRASPKLANLAVVVVTSDNGTATSQRLAEYGASAVLLKPLSPPRVAEALAHMKGGRA